MPVEQVPHPRLYAEIFQQMKSALYFTETIEAT